MRLGPFDEVGDDQEIARKVHAGDDVELEGEAIARKRLRRSPGAVPVLAQSPGKTRLRLAAKLGRFRLALRLGRGRAVHEVRQDRRVLRGRKAQRRGDLDGVLDRLGQIGEQRRHLAARVLK